MIDQTARDYSYVKTPVLAFLIAHELFRQELADQMPPEDIPRAKVGTLNPMHRTLNLLKKGPRKTADISRVTCQKRTATLTMLHRMTESGSIVRIGRAKDQGGTYTRAVWWELKNK